MWICRPDTDNKNKNKKRTRTRTKNFIKKTVAGHTLQTENLPDSERNIIRYLEEEGL